MKTLSNVNDPSDVFSKYPKKRHFSDPTRYITDENFVISETSAFEIVDKRKSNTMTFKTERRSSMNYYPNQGNEEGKTKKLSDDTYTKYFEEISGGKNKKMLYSDHPKVSNLTELPGMIYFLRVLKGARRPPRVGFPFRSYTECHYTTINRENPIICKVKEFKDQEEPQYIWRLYHYYSGNRRRGDKNEKKRRKIGDDSQPSSLFTQNSSKK